MVDVTMEGASEQPDSRWRRRSIAYLNGLIRRALPTLDSYVVDVWQLEWVVRPYGVPPFDRANPDDRVLISSFDSVAATGGGR